MANDSHIEYADDESQEETHRLRLRCGCRSAKRGRNRRGIKMKRYRGRRDNNKRGEVVGGECLAVLVMILMTTTLRDVGTYHSNFPNPICSWYDGDCDCEWVSLNSSIVTSCKRIVLKNTIQPSWHLSRAYICTDIVSCTKTWHFATTWCDGAHPASSFFPRHYLINYEKRVLRHFFGRSLKLPLMVT